MKRIARVSAVIVFVDQRLVRGGNNGGGRGQLHRCRQGDCRRLQGEIANDVVLSFGPSGQFYTQITQGAPVRGIPLRR